MPNHSTLTVNHVPHAWMYADATARAAATGFVTADLGKLALQSDNNTLWILTATTPTWLPVMPVPTGGDTAQVLTKASGNDFDLSWSDSASASSSLLGYVACVSGDYGSLNSASLADVDATNAKVTFTAPASGSVLVRLSATVSPGTGGVGQLHYWGLREATTDITGTGAIVARVVSTATEGYIGATKVFVLTGISAGAHTYKWSYKQSAGAATIASNANSQAVMEVWSL